MTSETSIRVKAVVKAAPLSGFKQIGTIAQLNEALPDWVQALKISSGLDYWSATEFSLLLNVRLDGARGAMYLMSERIPRSAEIVRVLHEGLGLGEKDQVTLENR